MYLICNPHALGDIECLSLRTKQKYRLCNTNHLIMPQRHSTIYYTHTTNDNFLPLNHGVPVTIVAYVSNYKCNIYHELKRW